MMASFLTRYKCGFLWQTLRNPVFVNSLVFFRLATEPNIDHFGPELLLETTQYSISTLAWPVCKVCPGAAITPLRFRTIDL